MTIPKTTTKPNALIAAVQAMLAGIENVDPAATPLRRWCCWARPTRWQT